MYSFLLISPLYADSQSTVSLEEKVGQLFMVSLSEFPSRTWMDFVKAYNIGGVLLMGSNMKSHQVVKTWTEALSKLDLSAPIFIGVDQEGGRVSRIKSGVHVLKPALDRQYVSMLDAESDGIFLGRDLKQLGVNLNFAPVLDLYSPHHTSVIANRSFSSDARWVSIVGLGFLKGLSSEGIIPVGKHFPGHGFANKDSHVALPTVTRSKHTLFHQDLYPFRVAVSHHVPMVMMAHVVYPDWDQKPASLSSVWITHILKTQMGFRGVVITDDLSMGAIRNQYSLKQACVKSINAGADMCLIVSSQAVWKDCVEHVIQAVKTGLISKSRLEDAYIRVMAVKKLYL